MTHFDKALEATRKGFVAGRDVADRLENVGLSLKHGARASAELQLRIARNRLMDLRLLVDDVEAHLRLSDAAEETALGKKKKESVGHP